MALNRLKLTPVNNSEAPALYAGPAETPGYVFQALDISGTPQIETHHATFADAVKQVALSMVLYGTAGTEWQVSDSE